MRFLGVKMGYFLTVTEGGGGDANAFPRCMSGWIGAIKRWDLLLQQVRLMKFLHEPHADDEESRQSRRPADSFNDRL